MVVRVLKLLLHMVTLHGSGEPTASSRLILGCWTLLSQSNLAGCVVYKPVKLDLRCAALYRIGLGFVWLENHGIWCINNSQVLFWG